MVLARRSDAGDFIYVGRVGTSLKGRRASGLLERFRAILRKALPLARGQQRDWHAYACLVRPEWVAEVRFLEWKSAGKLRHASSKECDCYKRGLATRSPEEVAPPSVRQC